MHQGKGLVESNKNLFLAISAVKIAHAQVAALRSTEFIKYKKRMMAFAGIVNVLSCDTLIPRVGLKELSMSSVIHFADFGSCIASIYWLG